MYTYIVHADPLITTCPMTTTLWSFCIWRNLERWKGSRSRSLMSWLKNQKIIFLKYRLFLFYTTTMNHFLIRLCCLMKSGLYMTTSNGQISGWAKKKSQSSSPVKLAPKFMVTVVVHCWSDHYSFLNPSEAKPSHLRSVLSKSMRCTQTCKVCSRHWSTEGAQFFTTVSHHTLRNQCF